MKLTPSLIAVLTLLIAGCSKSEPDLGEIKNGEYHNRFFGLTVSLPPDWEVLDRKNWPDNKPEIHLFMIFQPDSPLHSVNLSYTAYDLQSRPEILTGADFLASAKNDLTGVFKNMYPDLPITQDIITHDIGGRRFEVMRTNATKNNVTLHEIMAVTVIRSYALVFMGKYRTDEEVNTIQQVLDSITFDH